MSVARPAPLGFLLSASLLILLSASAHAQSAHLISSQMTIPVSGLSSPSGLAIDAGGSLYIADAGNNRVLKETPGGNGYLETTVATGLSSPAAVAVDAAGNVYIADTGNNRVLKETSSSGSYTQSIVASGFAAPAGVAVDASGNVYISDTNNGKVWLETLSGGSYTQSALTITGLNKPGSLAVDASGKVYVDDLQTGHVLVVKAGSTSSASGNFGAYTVGSAITLDSTGNIYTLGSDNSSVVEYVPSGTLFYPPASTSFYPYFTGVTAASGIAVDAHANMYVADTGNDRILKVSTASTSFGSLPVGSTSSSATLWFMIGQVTVNGRTLAPPQALTQGIPNLDFQDAGTGTCTSNGVTHLYSSGDLCSVDLTFTPHSAGLRPGALTLQNSSGSIIAMAYTSGSGSGPQAVFSPGTLTTLPITSSTPTGIAVDAGGNLYIQNSIAAYNPNNSVIKASWNGNGYTSSTVRSGLPFPEGVVVDGAGDVIILDETGPVYMEIPTASGYIERYVTSVSSTPTGIGVDTEGNIYIGTVTGLYKANAIQSNLGLSYRLTLIDSTVHVASSIVADAAGNLFVTTPGGPLYKETFSNGAYLQSTVAANSGIGLAIDPAGNLYTNTPFGTNVLKYTNTGSSYVQSTLLALSSDIGRLALDSTGNLYITVADNTIRKLDVSDPPTLLFASTGLNTTSSDSPQTVTLQNIGSAPLNFPIPAAGNNPSITTNFSLSSSGGTACPLVGSAASFPGTLAPNATCELPISYAPTVSTPLGGTLTLTDDSLNASAPAYATQQIGLGVTGAHALIPSLQWTNPAAILYGTPLSGIQLNATSSVAGTYTYTPAPGAVLGVGTQTLSVTFTPTDTADYATATASTSLQVNQATPAISWAIPAAIPYGTALSDTQLNATSSVAGAYTYTPAVGTVLGVGTQTLSVTFTPTDTTDYATATAGTTLQVNQATPIVTWSTPAAITYPSTLSATQLNATASVAGTFAYTPALGSTPGAGSDTLNVTFTPTDTTDYTTASGSTILQVNKGTPTITWSDPAAISYGTRLGATQLNATASIAGIFSYNPASGATLASGPHQLTVTFHPSDSSDYTTATANATLTVNPATPTITWATPAAIPYGTALSSTQLNATARVPGTFVYSQAIGIVLGVGPQPLSVTFTPTDMTNYTTATANTTLTVDRATPTITWLTPAAIPYGAALSAAQLNATASVAGTFTYSPATGAVLSAGNQTLSVTFTPTDTTNYIPTTGSVTLPINKAPLTAAVTNTVRVFGAANPAFTGTLTGVVNGDSLIESFSTSATSASVVGNYPIVPAVTGANLANYQVNLVNGALAISQAGSATTFALSNNNLTFTAAVASLTSGTPTGTVTFYQGQTAVGTDTLSGGTATYTASSFPGGDVVVSAQYSGDANFTQSAAPPILTLSVQPTLSSLSVTRSGSVTDNLALSVAPGYSGNVQFSCTGLPAGATCSFQPATYSFTGSNNATSVTLTIQTSATTAALTQPTSPSSTGNRLPLFAILWTPGLLALAFTTRRRKWNTRLHKLLLLLVLGVLSSAMIACGGASPTAPSTPTVVQTPAGSSTVQVVTTGTGGLTLNTSLALTVQ